MNEKVKLVVKEKDRYSETNMLRTPRGILTHMVVITKLVNRFVKDGESIHNLSLHLERLLLATITLCDVLGIDVVIEQKGQGRMDPVNATKTTED